MDPRQVSARFAAYVWFTGQHGEAPVTQGEALRFARESWPVFLPAARAGLGRLLIRLAAGGQSKRHVSAERTRPVGGTGS